MLSEAGFRKWPPLCRRSTSVASPCCRYLSCACLQQEIYTVTMLSYHVYFAWAIVQEIGAGGEPARCVWISR